MPVLVTPLGLDVPVELVPGVAELEGVVELDGIVALEGELELELPELDESGALEVPVAPMLLDDPELLVAAGVLGVLVSLVLAPLDVVLEGGDEEVAPLLP